MKTRNGKIARLPLDIREQLNLRLTDGEPGNRLVEWLNSNPEVQQVMAEQFESRPITENNLSEWRAGGYEEWLTLDAFLDETRVLSENSQALADAGLSSDRLRIVLLAHHACLLNNVDVMPENEFKNRLNTVRKLTASIMKMRRDELQKARLELQRERLEFLREKESLKSASSLQAAASTSANTRAPATKSRQPAASAPAPSHPDMWPGAESSRDEDSARPLFTINPKPASEIPILSSRIRHDFPVSQDWSDSVGLGECAPPYTRPARILDADFPVSALRSPVSPDWSDSVGLPLTHAPRLAA